MADQRDPTIGESDDARGDRWFGVNLKAAREAASMTQASLAKAMEDRGFQQFHAMTVSRIEAGERPVRLTEAFAIARIFDTSAGLMLQPPDELRVVERLEQAIDNVRTPLTEVERLAAMAVLSKRELRLAIDRAREVRAARDLVDYAEGLLDLEPEQAVSRGRDRIEVVDAQAEASARVRNEKYELLLAKRFAEAGYPISVGDRVIDDQDREGVVLELSPTDFDLYVKFTNADPTYISAKKVQKIGQDE